MQKTTSFLIKAETLLAFFEKKKKIREQSYELLLVVVVVASIDISTDSSEESFTTC